MLESRLGRELNRRVFDVTVAVYRVTEFFPKGEVLRNHVRSKAGEVFESAIEYGHSENREKEILILTDKIRVLKGYLAISRGMRYVKPVNFTVLEREYDSIEDILNRELLSLRNASEEARQMGRPAESREQAPSVRYEWPTSMQDTRQPAQQPLGQERSTDLVTRPKGRKQIEKFFESSINARQHIILEYLKHAKEAKISDFFGSFSGISTKTIQRDLQNLVERNVIKKEGEKKGTIYTLRSDYLF